jgi:peptide/nickel transport system permease protein
VRLIARRLLQGFVVIFGVTTIVFVVTRLVGDPVRMMLPFEATEEQRRAFAALLGLDRPLLRQYADFVVSLTRFDFGNSLWQDRPAGEIVLERMPATLVLVGSAMVLTIVLGVLAGVCAALRPRRIPDRLITTCSLVGLSMPQFWLGLLLIIVFAVDLGWLPSSGGESWAHAVLPAVTLALPSVGRLAMLTRVTMIDELNQTYVRTAQAKGLSGARIVAVHALRNAGNAILTVLGWELIRMLAGYSVVVETVFAWPGIGFLAVQSIERQDLMLLQAVVFTVAAMVVTINLVIDLAYLAMDPRITTG